MEKNSVLEGNIKKVLVSLAIPLFLGSILQQVYNATDAWLIGKFLGMEAFAAVGVSGAVMNLCLFIISGFCGGLSIIFAQIYGTGDENMFRQEMFLAVSFGSIAIIGISILARILLPFVLQMMQTPMELVSYCRNYLGIIFIGLIFAFLYNLFSAILRSVGDTRASLYFLIISAISNVLLDLFFIVVMKMEVAGAALATIIAQGISAFASILYLKCKYPALVCKRENMKFSKELLMKSVKFGLISAFHQSIIYIGRIFVQSAVNTLGTEGITAYTAALRIEGVVDSFGNSGADSISIFTSQNSGAGKSERVRQGFRQGVMGMAILGVIVAGMIFVNSKGLLLIFLENASMTSLAYGMDYIHIMAPFYILCFVINCFIGYFRGIGNLKIPFWGTIVQMIIRVSLAYLLVEALGLAAVAVSIGAAWIVLFSYHLFHFLRQKRKKDVDIE